MDPLTQIAVGAAVAGAFSSRGTMRAALVVGGLAGAAPDLDVLIRSSEDPLLGLQFHRHFTHALIVAPLIGLPVAWLARWIFYRKRFTTAELAPFGILGAATHGPLDACTSYGTLLYWPFSTHRESWDTISVIDPIFTIPLVLLVAGTALVRNPWLPRVACILCATYMALGLMQRERARDFAGELAAERNHSPAELTARPSFGNIVLWRTVYRNGDTYYVDAVNLFPGRDPIHYQGGTAEAFTEEKTASLAAADSTLARDIERFRFFSQGYLYQHPEDPAVIADLRYSLFPDSTLPLWGIRVDPSRPGDHTPFETFREASGDALNRLWTMILGRPLVTL